MSKLGSWLTGINGTVARRGILALVDQSLIAGINFVTALMLARLAPLNEYGAYALIFSVLSFLMGLQGALLTGPMMIYGAVRDGAELSRYLRAVMLLEVGTAIVLSLMVGMAWYVMKLAGGTPVLVLTIGAMGLSLVFILGTDFLRKACYARHAPAQAVAIDTVFCIMQLALIAALWKIDREGVDGRWLTSANVFLAMGLAGFCASFLGLWLMPISVSMRDTQVKKVLRECWQFGRWGLISIFVSLGYIQVLYVLVAALGGVDDVARLDGPRLIVAPCMLILMAWSNLVAPAAARRFSREGPKSLVSFVMRATMPLLAMISLILILILAFPRDILSVVLGTKYAAERETLFVWAGIVLMMALSTSIPTINVAALQPQFGTYARIAGAIVGLLAGAILIHPMGVLGSALARFVAEVAMALVAYYGVRHMIVNWKRGRSGASGAAMTESDM